MILREDDLIVFDDEYQYASTEFDDYCQALINHMDSYCEIMNSIVSEAVMDEKISANLKSLISGVEEAKKHIENERNDLRENCKTFVEKIDEADSFLY